MPTLCSMCGGTYGKADSMIRTHENPAARVVLLQALQSFAATPSTTTDEAHKQAESGPDPSPT